MSRTGRFSYSAAGKCDVATAVSLLSDLARQGELHPLIVSVERMPTVPGATSSWAITDRLAWGPLRFRIRYEADVLAVSAHRVETTARQRPATTVRNITTVTALGDRAVVDVAVELTAPTLLFGYAFRTAKAAHLELGRRIGVRLDELGRG